MKLRLLVLVFLAGFREMPAEVALLLEEPYGEFGALNPTGHAALYLSRVCADSPTRLRLCEPGELGVVISRYNRVAGYDWLAIPLLPYLYAVDEASRVPETADEETVNALRDQYRRRYLRELVPDGPGGETPRGDWVQLVGGAYNRKMYGFQIATTPEQDERLIGFLNAGPNHRRFNLFYRNCADFARKVLNFYHPGLVRRNLLADAGITTPKNIARKLVRHSRKHPEVELSAFVIPQVEGSVPRSKATRGVCESLVKSKKYILPLVIFHPWVAGSAAVAYLTGGRFNPARLPEAQFSAKQLSTFHPAVLSVR